MKINRFKYSVLSFLSISILFLALPGHAENGTLQVKCLEGTDSPSQNARVVAFNMHTQKAKDKKTDAQGLAEFTKMDDGAYRIIVRKEGFAPALHEFAVLAGNTETVTLNLAAGADRKLHFEDPAAEQQALQLLQQGLDLAKQDKYAEADKLFIQSLEIKPSSPETLYYYGAASMQEGNFDKAVDLLNRAVKVADALKTLPSMANANPNQYEIISRNGQQLVKQMPTYRGEQALRQKKYDEAIKIFGEAIKASPEVPDNHFNLAIALTNTGKVDEALVSIDKAIQLKPGDNSYAEMKKKIVARKEQLTLEKAQALMNEGNKLLQDGDAAGALKKYEESKSMIKEERQAPLWMQIGKAQGQLKQDAEAVASFKKSIELAPKDKIGDYRSAFAQYYIEAQKYDDAIEVLADPNAQTSAEQTLLDLAKTWKNKQPSFAIAALEKVLKLSPANADAHFDLGQLYYIEGKSKDARTKELLNKYLEIGKDAEKVQGAKDMLVIVNKRSK